MNVQRVSRPRFKRFKTAEKLHVTGKVGEIESVFGEAEKYLPTADAVAEVDMQPCELLQATARSPQREAE